MLVVHVDDILVVHDSSESAQELCRRLAARYPFGDWEKAVNGPITYTGKTIELASVDGKLEARVHQKSFIRGRLEGMTLEKRGRKPEDIVDGPEGSEFKSMCGSLCWVAGLTRPDAALDLNQLQTRQTAPRLKDCKSAIDLIKTVQDTVDTCLRIQPVEFPLCVSCFTDSALYNTFDESTLETDEQLREAEKNLVRSQHGALVVVMSRQDLDREGKVKASPIDWLSHASRRVVRSTFAAETGAALEALGRGLYVRALLAEVLEGPQKSPPAWSEEDMALRLITDCKSLYDNIVKDCSLCEDRHTALYVAALRQCVSAGPQRDGTKAGMLWVPSRHQLADGLTKTGLGEVMRSFLQSGYCQLHELSAQEIKRRKQDGHFGQETVGISDNLLHASTSSLLTSCPCLSTMPPSIASSSDSYIYIYTPAARRLLSLLTFPYPFGSSHLGPHLADV